MKRICSHCGKEYEVPDDWAERLDEAKALDKQIWIKESIRLDCCSLKCALETVEFIYNSLKEEEDLWGYESVESEELPF